MQMIADSDPVIICFQLLMLEYYSDICLCGYLRARNSWYARAICWDPKILLKNARSRRSLEI